MPRDNLSDLLTFIAVARERSFTKAAAKLGVSQSALSHAIRGLESRLGLRLLSRTTRSVSPTEAGERLLQTVGPHFEEIEAGLLALSELRDKPAGTIRIRRLLMRQARFYCRSSHHFLPAIPISKSKSSPTMR
jgi:DNA-binding transcriptional LysR family regulator